MSDFLKFLNNNKKTQDFLTATVTSIYPLQAKIIPTDSAINIVSTTGLKGLSIGCRILILKYLDQFIAISVLGYGSIEQCILRRTTSKTISTATLTKIDFSTGTTEYDPLSMHSESTNNTRITILSNGTYNVNISGRWEGSTNGSGRFVYIYVNNTAINATGFNFDSAGRAANNASLNLNLEKDDYVEMVVYQISGGDLDFATSGSSSAHFSVVKI